MSTEPWGIDMHSFIETISGDMFDFTCPGYAQYTIEDIAHSLSQLCRFTGHTRRFYSVAQHSVVVSLLVPRRLGLAGLLHDAHEAFVNDISSPLKTFLPDYKQLEDRIQASVLARFGLSRPLPPEIKAADLVALKTEKRDLMHSGHRDTWGYFTDIKPWRRRILPLPAPMAKQLFLDRYRGLTR